MGKGGARLFDMSDEFGVVAVIAAEGEKPEDYESEQEAEKAEEKEEEPAGDGAGAEPQDGGEEPKEDAKMEAAEDADPKDKSTEQAEPEAMEVEEEKAAEPTGTDGAQPMEVSGDKAEEGAEGDKGAPPEEEKPIAAGDTVEGKFGAEYLECTVLEIGEKVAKVRWAFDGEEDPDDVVVDKLRRKPPPPPEKPPWKPEAGAPAEAKFGRDFRECTILEVGDAVIKVRWADDGAEDEVVSTKVREKDERPPQDGAQPGGLAVGQKAEAKYGNSFFSVTIVEISNGSVKVRWDHDGSESACPEAEVRCGDAEQTPPGGLAAGARAEAKYGNSFFDVTVVEVGESTIKVKWDHDQSEAECPKDEVRLK
ncbi:unnamed protein product, partial [Prorocentrum cordatum]